MHPSRVFQAQNPIGAIVEIDPGEGNLDARAYTAAVLGPLRAAHGNKGTKNLVENQGVLIATNSPASQQVGFVAVTLTAVDAGGPRIAMFDGANTLGGSSVPVTLTRTISSLSGVGFAAVLLPGDELYAQSAPGEGPFNIAVFQVWF